MRQQYDELPKPKTYEGMSQYRPPLCFELTGREFAAEYHLRERVQKGEIPYAVHGWSKDFADYKDMQAFLRSYNIDI